MLWLIAVLLGPGLAAAQPDACLPDAFVRSLTECPRGGGPTPSTADVAALRPADGPRRDRDDFARRELTAEQARYASGLRQLECAGGADAINMRYARARVHYEANRFEEAAAIFSVIYRQAPDHDLASYAANLYVDSLNLAGTHQGRPGCLDVMIASLDPMDALFCRSRSTDPDLCEWIDQLRCEAIRHRAERAPPEEGARAFLDLARGDCERQDEALHNAAVLLERADRLESAIAVRRQLVDRFPASVLARFALAALAGAYRRLVMPAEEADALQTFAARYPAETGADCGEGECLDARAALRRAIELRVALRDERAVRDAELFLRHYGRTERAAAIELWFAAGRVLREPRAVATHYETFLSRHSAAPIHLRVRASLLAGRARAELRDARRAEPLLAAAEAERGAAEAALRAAREEAEARLRETTAPDGDATRAVIDLEDALADLLALASPPRLDPPPELLGALRPEEWSNRQPRPATGDRP